MTWRIADASAADRVLERMLAVGARLLCVGASVHDEDAARALFLRVVKASTLSRACWWTWSRLQVALESGQDTDESLVARGYDYLVKGRDRRHAAWEHRAKELASNAEVDRSLAEQGMRVEIRQAELASFGERVLDVVDERLKELSVQLRDYR